MKVLNLYAGIGGNRKLWPKEVEVIAIENNPKIAKIYKTNFPDDKVLVEDAHDYLLKHYKEFDFIWSSPPCQTHSGMNNFLNPQGKIRYPDMSLWQEIIYLRHFCKVKWVVENVKSMYYEPLIPAQVSGRHYFWANFIITNVKNGKADIGTFNRSASKIFAQQMNTKNQLERNAVDSKLGLHIFKCAFKEVQLPLAVNKKEDGLPPTAKAVGIRTNDFMNRKKKKPVIPIRADDNEEDLV